MKNQAWEENDTVDRVNEFVKYIIDEIKYGNRKYGINKSERNILDEYNSWLSRGIEADTPDRRGEEDGETV